MITTTARRTRRIARPLAAVLAAACLVLAPTAAVAAPGVALAMEEPAGGEAEEGSGRRPVAETPRDQLGLIVLGALAAAAALGLGNARRQLRGERPKADGQFRWR